MDSSIAGAKPSSFRLYFDKTLIELVRTVQKTSTLRIVKESKKWWETLENALLYGNRLVRAQSNRANNTIFGWLRIDSISESGTVLSFLNPMSKKELGCDGWSNDEYIAKWCDGERDMIVRRIYFTYIPYADIPDYQYTKLDVKAAIDDCAARTTQRLRTKGDSVNGQMQMAEEPGNTTYDVPGGQTESVSQVAALVRRLDDTVSALQSKSVLGRNDVTQGRHDDRAKDEHILTLQQRIIDQTSHALDAQRQALETQQKAFEREQSALETQRKAFEREQAKVQEGLVRERTEAKAALMREQQLNDNNRASQQYLAVEASRQKFFMDMMQSTHFAALLNTTSLQSGILTMMKPSSAPVAFDAPVGNSSSPSPGNLELGFEEKKPENL